MTNNLKQIRVKIGLVAWIFIATQIQAQEQNLHGHTHYRSKEGVDNHKLIFPSPVPDRVIVNLTENPSTSFAVNWRTDQTISKGMVQISEESHGPEIRLQDNITTIEAITEFFENENYRDNKAAVKAAYHSAIVSNLVSGKTYTYRVGYGEPNAVTWSEWYQIVMPENGVEKPFSFIYFGDAQNDVKSMWSRVIRKSYKMVPNVDFMLHAGDLINHSESNAEWGEWFYAGGFIHATVPSVMTPGNHEYYRDSLSSLWNPQFNLPQNGPKVNVAETYYHLDYKNMKLISFDVKNFEEFPEHREQVVKWLADVLATNDKKWITVFMHYPLYSTAKGRDNTDLRLALKPLLDTYKVDLVLQGHGHTYARGYDSNQGEGQMKVSNVGTVYTVSVSGPKMYEAQNQDWMVRRGEYTQLFQILTVGKDKIDYEAFTPLGGLYDAFEIHKTDDGVKTIVNPELQMQQRFKSELLNKE